MIAQCRDLLQQRLDYAAQRRRELPRRGPERAAGRRRPSATTAIMYYGGAESWNLRDTPHVRDARAPARGARAAKPKAVVWAHNSHIGDARCTEMGQVRDELNIGQLCRERFGDEARADRLRHAYRHGRGRVRLGRRRWRSSACGPRCRDSYERLCHDAGVAALPARPARRPETALRRAPARAAARALHRRDLPARDRAAEPLRRAPSLPQQFDAWVWFDETSAVVPLGPEHAKRARPTPGPSASDACNGSLPSPVCGGRWPEGPEGVHATTFRAIDGHEHEDPHPALRATFPRARLGRSFDGEGVNSAATWHMR